MPIVHDLFPSFNTGELSPRLAARVDFAKFKSGVATLENFIPLSEGGAMRRSGSRFIIEVKDSTAKTRLKKFEFSTTQAYILEMGNNYMRFFKEQGQIFSENITASITNGLFPAGVSSWDDISSGTASRTHDAVNLRMNLIGDGTNGGHAEQEVTNATAIDHVLRFQVFGAPGDSVTFQVGTSTGATDILSFDAKVGFHVITFTATAANFFVQFVGEINKTVQVDTISLLDNEAIDIGTPWLTADLFEVEGPQSADVLYLFHGNHPTYKLERRADTTWSLVEVPWEDGPYFAQNSETTTLAPSAITGETITVTASSTTGINGGSGFLSTDIGRSIRISNPAAGQQWGWGVIVSITSTTVIEVDIKHDFARPPPTITGTTIAFANSNPDTITDSGGSFLTSNFAAGDVITVSGSTGNDGSYTIDTVVAGTITLIDADSLTFEAAGASITITAPGATKAWKLGAWSSTTGYPAAGAFFEQRLFAANTTDNSQTFWASQTADFELHRPDSDPVTDDVFDGTVEDDDALDYTLSADDVNAIFWLSAGEDTLAIGTAGGEWVPSSVGAVLTPSDINVKRQITTKAANIQPVRVDNVVLFVQRAKRKLKEFGFAFEIDGFQSVDMTRLAQHITVGGITEMAFAEEQESQVWAIRGDGQLLSMTFRRNEDVVGWSRHIFGGQFAGGNAVTASTISFTATNTIADSGLGFGDYVAGDVLFIDGSASNDFGDIGLVTIDSVADDHGSITIEETTIVTEAAGASITITAMSDTVCESVATIPGIDGAGQVQNSSARDEVWTIIKRTINGVLNRYVEMLERDFEDGEDQEDAYYSDSLVTYDSVSTTTITGLSHLEGETVKIWADGAIHADKVVSSGAITLDTASKVVQVGLGYTHKLKFLRLEGGNAAGTAVGKKKRIIGISFIFLNCHTVQFGPDDGNLTEFDFRQVSDSMDAAVPLFTGDQFYEFPGDWDEDPRILIQHDDPAPFTLLAAAPRERLTAVK